MKITVVVLLLAAFAVVFSQIATVASKNQEFQDFKKTHNKKYEKPGEEEFRFKIYS